MKLDALLAGLDPVHLMGSPETEISEISIDNRRCPAGSLFVCIKGYAADGHQYAISAVENGAAAILAQDAQALIQSEDALRTGAMLTDQGLTVGGKTVPVAITDHTRFGLSFVSDALYGHPSGKLRLIGVTGTKGKTSTTYMLRAIYQAAGQKTGLIGTICNMIGDRELPTERTTPEANILQALLHTMTEEQIRTCMMEVSSQGLHLDRVSHCTYSTAVFTNLTPDHIGATEHTDMDDYAHAKAKLFTMCRRALINGDSPYAGMMIQTARENGAEVYTYGLEEDRDFRAEHIETEHDHVAYDVRIPCGRSFETIHVYVPCPGRFSVYNSLAALACAYLEGIPPECAIDGLRHVFVKGKAENVPTGRDFSVLIDYAHNPDSFINILTTVKEYAKRTVFLFGCGGDRNRPRALMGKTAGEYADLTIITSDNPRSEDPEAIIRDIEEGIRPTGAPYLCITDRKEAIAYALRHAQPGDVIILAGKGHETEQILKDRTIHFDEREVVREILQQMRAEEQK